MALKLADYFTLGNFLSGVLAIFCVIEGFFILSAILILFAVLFDFLDGRIARFLKQQNSLGKELDSLADVVSFGVWPAVFGFSLGLNSSFAIAILLFFSSCGIYRLARFNITKLKGFEGVPITMNGILFPLIYLIFNYNNYVLIVYFVMGILMISKFRIKKW